MDFCEFQEHLNEGIRILRSTMSISPPFDPNRPYAEKNLYANAANNIGQEIYKASGNVKFAEIYYAEMIKQTIAFEDQNSITFNKGIFYANYGIYLLAQGHIELGTAYLFAAEEEDREIADKDWFIDDTHLWLQFENPIVHQLYQRVCAVSSQFQFTLTDDFIEDFIKSLSAYKHDRQLRVFFVTTVMSIFKSLLLLQSLSPNNFIRSQLYVGLHNICLLTEVLLKQNHTGSNLASLLGAALGYQHQPPSNWRDFWRVEGLEDYLKKINYALDLSLPIDIGEVCTRLTRNFTSHHFEVTVKPSEDQELAVGQTFDQLYEKILSHILALLFYLKHEGKILTSPEGKP
ncbi:MAG: hypothetical protein OHK0046_48800 [Anaerolineae bacterium]